MNALHFLCVTKFKIQHSTLLLFDVAAFSNSYNMVVCFLCHVIDGPAESVAPSVLFSLVVSLYVLSLTRLFNNYRVARQ